MPTPKPALAASLGAALTAATLILAAPAQGAPAAPVVRTASGPVAGIVKGGSVQFLGLPFAAPPTGALRWRPPVAPAPWKAVRRAAAFGPQCAQSTTLGVFAGPPNSNEDCLTLNVIAPRAAAGGKTRLPVLVWLHGGGNVDGSASDYDAAALAVKGRAIVVTVNYRLNLFGFMAHPAIDKEGHPFANYGLLDQQFALKWVRTNIARFGGDPANVTLGGQSAGGSNTGLHLTSPLARGLFHKAVIVSSGSYLTAASLPQAQAKGVAMAKAAGCGEGTDEATAACLRALPAEAIMRLAGTPTANGAFILPIIADGQVVPTGGASAFEQGRFTRMPVINGTVRDEGGFFTGIEQYGNGTPPWRTITNESVERTVRGAYAANAERILAAYPAARYATPQWRSNAIQSDAFVCKSHKATHLLAGKVPLYVYEFRDRTAPSYFPDMPGYEPGAYHTADLLYLFPGFHGTGIKRDLTPRQQRLADRMISLLGNFMRTGNPNAAVKGKGGNAPWPAVTAKAANYIAFNANGLGTISDAGFASDHQCALWQEILPFN